jgi:hypothetical protein
MEVAMNTRLTINLRDGLLEVEGGEDFVRTIYQDFKAQVARAALKAVPAKPFEQLEQAPAPIQQVEARRQTKPRGNRSSDSGKIKASNYRPTFKDLNLAGLGEFYDQFAPANHNEKILCFAVFLRDQLKISPCTADDIYTCYFTLKTRTKTPVAFQQAFITAKSRTHFIQFDWPQKIEVTIAGDNFCDAKLRAGGSK